MSKNLTMKLRLGWGAEGVVAFSPVPGGVPKTPSPHPAIYPGPPHNAPGSFFASEELGLKTAQDRITIYGPKADGTYIVEFKTVDAQRGIPTTMW